MRFKDKLCVRYWGNEKAGEESKKDSAMNEEPN